jgi:hypothetical protein
MKRNAVTHNFSFSIHNQFIESSRTEIGTTERNWDYMISFLLRTLFRCSMWSMHYFVDHGCGSSDIYLQTSLTTILIHLLLYTDDARGNVDSVLCCLHWEWAKDWKQTHRLPVWLVFTFSVLPFLKMEVTFKFWLVTTGRGGEGSQSMLFGPQFCSCAVLNKLVKILSNSTLDISLNSEKLITEQYELISDYWCVCECAFGSRTQFLQLSPIWTNNFYFI